MLARGILVVIGAGVVPGKARNVGHASLPRSFSDRITGMDAGYGGIRLYPAITRLTAECFDFGRSITDLG
jgi:hypothetical protein